MNENINLTKILKDCPKGWKFWSPIFGEVEFVRNYGDESFVNVSIEDGSEWSFASDATIFFGNIKSREVMLYPSRELRDWSKFKAPWYKKEKFDPKTLKPFDKVIGRDLVSSKWECNLFSHIDESANYPYRCIGNYYKFCIPFNDDTKHLVETKEEAPEYYRYWED